MNVEWREDEYYQRLADEHATEGIATAIPSSFFTRLASAIRRQSPVRSIPMEPTTTRFGRFTQDPQPYAAAHANTDPYPAPPTWVDGLAYVPPPAPPAPVPVPARKSRKPLALVIGGGLVLVSVVIALIAGAKPSAPASYSDYRNPDVLGGAVKSMMQAKLAAKGYTDITVTSVNCLPKESLRFVCMATTADGDHASSTVTVSADGQSYISDPGGN